MSVTVIDARKYVSEYQTDDFSGAEQMFDEHGDAVIVDWGEDMTLKTALRSRGKLIGINNRKIDQAIEPGMCHEAGQAIIE